VTYRCLGIGLLLGMIAVSGCGRKTPRPPQAVTENADAQQLSEILGTLNSLDNYVGLEVRPSRVLLDAKKSKNQDVIKAVLGPHPDTPNGPIKYLHVTTGNSGFQDIQVRPGDFVRLYLDDEYGNRRYLEVDIRTVFSNEDLEFAQDIPQDKDKPIAGLELTIEIWRRSDEKLAKVLQRLQDWVKSDRSPLDWEPSPEEEILQQLSRRLNQVVDLKSESAKKSWEADALFATLPSAVREKAAWQPLDSDSFDGVDARALQEAAMLRDVTRQATVRGRDELERVAAIFDWVVRHIQLESRDSLQQVWRRPWQTLLFGRGTAEDRAWVFVAMCRHLELPGVVFKLPENKDAAFRPCLTGVLIGAGQAAKLYLFDTATGLPIPAADKQSPATLTDVLADDGLLRKLDLDADHPYPLRAEELKEATALLVAAPTELSFRMQRLEELQSGNEKLLLAYAPSKSAEKLKAAGLGEIGLWDYPFLTYQRQNSYPQSVKMAAVHELLPFVWRPALWRARMVDFKRRGLPATEGANEDDRDREAKDLYMKMREPDATGSEVDKGVVRGNLKLKHRDWSFGWARQITDSVAVQHVSFWLGQIAADRGTSSVAIDYFQKRVLDAFPGGVWSPAARFNLALAYLQAGQADRAGEWFAGVAAQTLPAQRHGDKVRAARLAPATPAEKPAENP